MIIRGVSVKIKRFVLRGPVRLIGSIRICPFCTIGYNLDTFSGDSHVRGGNPLGIDKCGYTERVALCQEFAIVIHRVTSRYVLIGREPDQVSFLVDFRINDVAFRTTVSMATAVSAYNKFFFMIKQIKK